MSINNDGWIKPFSYEESNDRKMFSPIKHDIMYKGEKVGTYFGYKPSVIFVVHLLNFAYSIICDESGV